VYVLYGLWGVDRGVNTLFLCCLLRTFKGRLSMGVM
jgi:hypothetical protein